MIPSPIVMMGSMTGGKNRTGATEYDAFGVQRTSDCLLGTPSAVVNKIGPVAKLKTKKLFLHKRYKNLISLFEHLTKYIYKLAKISELI